MTTSWESPRCTWARCPAPAAVSVDFWLFLGPIDYCRPHAARFVAELHSLGADAYQPIVGPVQGRSGYPCPTWARVELGLAS